MSEPTPETFDPEACLIETRQKLVAATETGNETDVRALKFELRKLRDTVSSDDRPALVAETLLGRGRFAEAQTILPFLEDSEAQSIWWEAVYDHGYVSKETAVKELAAIALEEPDALTEKVLWERLGDFVDSVGERPRRFDALARNVIARRAENGVD